jgi:hypothetical protein
MLKMQELKLLKALGYSKFRIVCKTDTCLIAVFKSGRWENKSIGKLVGYDEGVTYNL